MSTAGDVGACAERGEYMPPWRRRRVGAQGSGQFPMTQTHYDHLVAAEKGMNDPHEGSVSEIRATARAEHWAGTLFLLLIVVALVLAILLGTSHARDNGQWGNSPAQVRQWFQSLMQPDNPYMSCCGEADAFEADTFEIEGDHYVAIITDGKGVLPPGTRIPVPIQKMKWDAGNPTGHGIIFIGNARQLYCYVAPGGV